MDSRNSAGRGSNSNEINIETKSAKNIAILSLRYVIKIYFVKGYLKKCMTFVHVE